MEQWVIYKHTSMKSGKSYIGQTKRTYDWHLVNHIDDAIVIAKTRKKEA